MGWTGVPTSRCYSLLNAKELSLQFVELPAPLDGQLFCETVYSAISPGTELAAYNGLPPLRPTTNVYPRLLGYMNVARVVETGNGLSDQFPVGTLVYTNQAHRSHFVISSSDVLAVVPSGLAPHLATVAYLYRLGWNGLRRAQIREGGEVAVVGLGAIGLASLQLAKHLGFGALGLSDHEPARKAGEKFGCSTLSKKRALQLFLGEPPASDLRDAVLLTSNVWVDWQLSLAMSKFNGVVSVIGFPGRNEPLPEFNPLNSEYFYDKQLTVSAAGFAPGSVGVGAEQPEQLKQEILTILDWMNSDRLDPKILVASVEPADKLFQIYEAMNTCRDKAGTIVLDWSAVD